MLDGRVRRGRENRRAMIDSICSLIEDGVIEPTAELVAGRAGLGVRSVFRHFRDIEGLRAEVVARLVAEALPNLQQPRTATDLAGRVRETLDIRARFFEAQTAFRRAGDAVSHRSAVVRSNHADLDRLFRDDIKRNFAAELAASDATVLDLIDALLSFPTWLRLRGPQALSVPAARRLLEGALLAILPAGRATRGPRAKAVASGRGRTRSPQRSRGAGATR